MIKIRVNASGELVMGNIVITSSPITMIRDFVNPMGSDQAGDAVL